MSAILSLLINFAFSLFRAWTLTMFWLWYVAGPFHVRAITLTEAMGVSLIAFMLTFHFDSSIKREKYEPLRALFCLAITYMSLWLSAGFIYLVKAFL